MSEYLSYSELREGDESSLSLAKRLSKYPHLRHRMESILGIIENDDGSCQTADEAERRAIEEVRKLGQEVLQALIQKRLKLPGAWWKKQHADQMIQLRVARANGKWDCYWQQLQRA